MWLAIWGIFAAFVAAFVIWTIAVLLQQKRAWLNFSKKHNLKYQPGAFMSSPTVTGELSGWKFSLYTGVQQTDDIRGQRFVSVIEFQLGRGMPTGAAIATKEFSGFVGSLVFDRTIKPELAEWDKTYLVSTRSALSLKAYLTKERQQILHGIFSMKNAAVLFFFDEIEAVLRIETADPLRNEDHLNKIVQRLLAAIARLAPSEAEKKEFRKLFAAEKKRREQGIDEDDLIEAEIQAALDAESGVEEPEIPLPPAEEKKPEG